MSWLDIFSPDLHWQIFTAEIILLVFALLAPLVGARVIDRKGMRQFALIGLGGGFVITLGTLFQWQFGIPGINIDFTLNYIDACNNAMASGDRTPCSVYAVTPATQLFKLVFLGVSFLAVLGAGRVLRGKVEEDWGEFFSLILFATLGMMIVASSRDLIVLLLGIEIASMSSYLLAAFRRDAAGAEAGMKYFLFGAASSGLTLYAISLLYGIAGTTRIYATGAEIEAAARKKAAEASSIGTEAETAATDTLIPTIRDAVVTGGSFDLIGIVAIVLLIAGLGFKISSAPFHLWAPDVYYGAPAPVAGMLAAGSKAMGFAAVFNVFLVGLIGVAANWQLAVAAIAVVSMFVGNLVALQQQSLRRMLAYSSIAQAGYVLIAVVVAGAAFQTNEFMRLGTWAVGGGILHLIVNAAMKLGAFLVVGALLLLGVPDRIESYRGLGRRNAFLAFAMAIFLLSMAGIPPLGGFTSKFILFGSAIDTGISKHLGWLIWLAVFAVINSAISLYYYLRVIRAMYVEGEDTPDTKLSLEPGARIAIGVCLALVLLIGIYPQWFVEVSFEAAASLISAAQP